MSTNIKAISTGSTLPTKSFTITVASSYNMYAGSGDSTDHNATVSGIPISGYKYITVSSAVTAATSSGTSITLSGKTDISAYSYIILPAITAYYYEKVNRSSNSISTTFSFTLSNS